MRLRQVGENGIMEILAYFLVCVVSGLGGAFSLGLIPFLKKVEKEEMCIQCMQNSTCFGRKRLFKDSNYLSEFMLLSYYKVFGPCRQENIVSVRNKLNYFICNTILVGILFWSRRGSVSGVVFGVSASAMLFLSLVDWKTQYIPFEMDIIIFICGLINLFADVSNWLEYVIGLITVSGFLLLVNAVVTPVLKKKYQGEREVYAVIGDGDIKLMAATGLLLGWKLNFLALGIGCVTGSVIHLILMKIKGSDRQFALGPYLSLGVYTALLCGEQLIGWYLNLMGGMPE